jgi:RNA recognition motif-containing protein
LGIYWDRIGLSKGEGYVEFYNRRDAENALQELNCKNIFF